MTAEAQSNYTTFCAKCHGDTGKGNGSGAATLATKPRDFTDCARMAKESDDMLFKVIKEGGKPNGFSGDMQAWNNAFEDRRNKGPRRLHPHLLQEVTSPRERDSDGDDWSTRSRATSGGFAKTFRVLMRARSRPTRAAMCS